jgi:beta-glucanase (GH16 family)
MLNMGFAPQAYATTGCEQHSVSGHLYQCVVEVGAGMCLRERDVTTFALEGCLPHGSTVDLARQVRLKNHPVNGSTIWDILQNGWMVSDDYLDTGHYNAFSPPIPHDASTTPTATPTATSTATATPTATASTTATPTAQVTPTASTGSGPVGQTGNWKLLFHDEFDGASLDTSKWTTCYFNFRVGTNACSHDQGELELYQPQNVSVSNGVLSLTAQKQQASGFSYTSGMISSGPACDGCASRFTFTYGSMEMRAKIPAGQGLWPAFWTLPADLSWPPEIDVFEILGNAPHEINLTYHWPNGTGDGAQKGNAWDGPDFSAGWHTYAVDWEPGSLTWYVDGVERFRYTGVTVVSKPMYLVANLAVGGDWPGPPDASTSFPAVYQIDFIRVWQHA